MIKITETEIVMCHLPFPPSENNMYFNRRGGGRAPSEDLARFKWSMEHWRREHARLLVDAAKQIAAWKEPPFLTFALGFRRDRVWTKDGRMKRNDAANYIKALQDSLMQGLGIDDSYLAGTSAEKAPLRLGDEREFAMAILEPCPVLDMRDWLVDAGIV